MIKLFKILFKKRWLVLITVIAIVAQCWMQLNLPEYMGNIQTILIYKNDALAGGSLLTDPVSLSNPLSGQITIISTYLSTEDMINLILSQGLWMLICCFIILGCALVQNFTAARTGAFVGKYLREKIYNKVNTLSLSQYSHFGTSTLITRTTNDIEQIKNYIVMSLRTLVMSPTYMIIAIIKTLSISYPGPILASVLAICIPLVIVAIIVLFVSVGPIFKMVQKRIDDVTVVLRENLTGIRVIRAYNQEPTENNKFDKVNQNLKKIITKSGRIMSAASPFISIVFNLCYIGIYALGFYLLTTISSSSVEAFQSTIASQITIISVVAQYSMQIMNSFLMFAMILIMIPQASASFKRINEVIETTPDIDDSKARGYLKELLELDLHKKQKLFKDNYKLNNNKDFSYSLLKEKYLSMSEEEKEKDPQYKEFISYTNIKKEYEEKLEIVNDLSNEKYIDIYEEYFKNNDLHGVIEFKDVTFQYSDSNTPTIYNISFKTKPGTTTAIIGSTGSGKSTLINLIPRFYDATSGEILFNGINIKNLPQKILREHLGFVPQTALLFSGTIKENIAYGKNDATDEEILNALSVAQAEHFVSKLPEGINSFVSQGGKNFSGGQKQRLAIARSLIKKPEIYVFDDSFSALDFKTDAKLRYELKKVTKDSSVIVVAQRVSSILDADNIIVLNEGKCVGEGKHEELLKSCPVYQDIVRSQLDSDEIDKTLSMNKSITEGVN